MDKIKKIYKKLSEACIHKRPKFQVILTTTSKLGVCEKMCKLKLLKPILSLKSVNAVSDLVIK